MTNPFRDNVKAFRSLATKLRELAPRENDPRKQVKMQADAVWYDERANQHEDMADDLDERETKK